MTRVHASPPGFAAGLPILCLKYETSSHAVSWQKQGSQLAGYAVEVLRLAAKQTLRGHTKPVVGGIPSIPISTDENIRSNERELLYSREFDKIRSYYRLNVRGFKLREFQISWFLCTSPITQEEARDAAVRFSIRCPGGLISLRAR